MRFATVDEWLEWQQTLHPRAIDLGLARVGAIAERLGVHRPTVPVISVGGTNGKGSCVAFLTAMLAAAGYRVGTYTSPHLLRYNERIRIDREPVRDNDLLQAFARVDEARGTQSLSYFEFGTLAAFDLFSRSCCDVWVLEVGLGGRLDAVNIVDPTVALITSIGLDHTDWLGSDRETIGAEKAGLLRPRIPAVFGGANVPESVLAKATELRTELWVADRDYDWDIESHGAWSLNMHAERLTDLPKRGLAGEHQYANAATAIAAVRRIRDRLPVPVDALRRSLSETVLPGRLHIVRGTLEWVFDVAHNHDSATALAAGLATLPTARTWAVLAVMQRKALEEVVRPLLPHVDAWLPLVIPDGDVRPAGEVAQRLAEWAGPERVLPATAPDDLRGVLAGRAVEGDRVVVCGSFRTVEEVLRRERPPAMDEEREQ